jgi:hypothetical protein
MSSLTAINKTLIEQNKLVKTSIEGTATEKAKQAEERAERKTYDTEVLSTLKAIHGAMGGSAGGGLAGADKKTGGWMAGLMRGLGNLAGGIFKMISKIGVGFIKGMGSLGAGIGAFFLAIGGASLIAKYAGVDGEALKTLIQNFFGAFSGTDMVALAALVVGGIIVGKIKGGEQAVMRGMGAIGIGIAAFMGGILLADGLAKLGSMVKLDGSSLATLITNFTAAFTGTDGAGIAALGVLIAAGAVLGITGGTGPVIAGMAAIGAGIAAFAGGLLLADAFAKLGKMAGLDGSSINTLITNFTSAFTGTDGAGIAALGVLIGAGIALGFTGPAAALAITGMGALGAGIAAFMGGLVLADWIAGMGGDNAGGNLKVLLTNVGQAIGGFVGGMGKGIMDQLKDIDTDKLSALGIGIKNVGIGMVAGAAGMTVGLIGGLMSGLGAMFGVESPIDKIVALSKDSSIDTKRLKELGEGIGPLGQGLAGFSGLDFGGSFFGGDSLDDFIKSIAKLGSGKIDIDAGRLKSIGNSIKPLADGIAGFSGLDMEKIVGSDTSGRGSDLQRFFGTLSEKNVSQVAGEATMKNAAAGIGPLAKAMASFGSLDLDKITGGLGEDNLSKFFEGIGTAANNIKKPEALRAIGEGISDLAKGLRVFANIDSDTLVKNMGSLEKIQELQKGDSSFISSLFNSGQQVQEAKTMDFAQKSAMNVSGGTVVVNNDNSVINNDNRNSTVNQTSVAAKMQVESKKEG